MPALTLAPLSLPAPLASQARRRLPHALAVLALHGLFIVLLHRAMGPLDQGAEPSRSVLVQLSRPAEPRPREPHPAAATPPRAAVLHVPLPEFSVASSGERLLGTPELPASGTARSSAAVGNASAPLNLSLPPPGQRTRLPAIAEQMRHDPRANSPMPSGEQRMAAALGAKGWTVIDLGDGSKKVMGPFGECAIVRPSMVDGIAGHPHAGLLPGRSFPCGGVEKGSLEHARPHERRP